MSRTRAAEISSADPRCGEAARPRPPALPAYLALATSLLAAAVLTTSAYAQTYAISTVAGGALPVNIPGPAASLYGPQSAMAVDATGNLFFVDGNTVLRLDANSGVLTLVAGTGTAGYSGDNGPATSAQLHSPNGIALDSSGNLYIASFYDNVVREVSGGIIATVVGTGVAGFSGDGGPASAAQLNAPFGITLDSAGNLYIADYGNSRIREVSGGVIATVAGNGIAGFGGDNGPATSAQLNGPRGVAVDGAGNLYIADCLNNRIRKVTAGGIGTVAGNGAAGFGGDNGPAVSAQLNVPSGIALDSTGILYIADYYNNRVRKVTNGIIATMAGKGGQGFSGDNGPATGAQLNDPLVVAVDSAGNLYIADYGNNRIRKVSNGTIVTVAGNGASGFSGDGGSAASAQLHDPYSVALDVAGDLYIADYQNNRIRKVTGGIITTLAGTGAAGFGGDSGPASSAQLNQPSAVALDSAGNVYIADTANNRIRKISGAGTITTVAGNGTAGFGGDAGAATSAQLNQPAGIAVDSTGNLYIADTLNNRIRKVSAGTITTVAGNGTPGFAGDGGAPASAQLRQPAAVGLDTGNNLYIADTGNYRIRKVSGGTIATVAGNGTAGFAGDNAAAASAQLNAPAGIAVGTTAFYIADTLNNAVRAVSGGTIATIAGRGASFGDGGAATSAELSGPQGVGLDGAGNVFLADTQNNRIRELTPLPLSITAPTSLPSGTVGAVYAAVAFTAAGGAGGYTWSATGLPKGLAISAAGSLSGTPTVAGSSTPQFTVKDSANTVANSSIPLTIGVPVPTITTVSPASATVYGASFTLTVNGTAFAAGATIQWNGTALTTKVVSATQLTASVAASLIASPGSATIVVTSGGVSSGSFTFPINPPVPTITTLSPASATATTAGFTLTVTGTGFVQASQVEWIGAALTTTFVSATQLTATVSASLIAAAGTASVTVTSGGTPSGSLTFTINAPPAITTLSPASATAGGATFTLTVTGTGFVAGSAIQWNGAALTTKVVSATQLTASVTASLIATAGSATIVVTSGGFSSNSLTLPINNPTPTATTLSPASTTATTADFTLTVTGTGFVQTSQVQWNGSALTTAFVSATQLTATVTASLIATAGTASVTVTSGGTPSGSLTFTINAPAAITTLSPASATAGGATFTLTVTGTGFLAGAAIQWNGTALTTKVVSATQLTASVTASLIATAGSATIVVTSGGVLSNSLTLPINNPTPTATALSPASTTATTADFTLTVTGTGFVQASQVQWNGGVLTTTFVSATQLTATVSASLIATAGTASVTVTSGGTPSGSLTFTINAPAAITTLSPASATAGGATFTLTVTGTGFLAGTAIQWNGAALTTKVVSATQLTASVTASLIATAGSATILVTSGGVSSNSLTFTINNPTPTVTTLSPTSATATTNAFTLTVTGTGFVQSSQVQWNGSALATTFVSATQLTASVSSTLIASAGTASVTVATGQTSSSALTFTINAPPAVTSVSPSSVIAFSAAFTLTVNGTGFAAGATVQWNTSPLTTKVVSSTQLTASVPANLIGGAGSVMISVTAGGATSAVFSLPIVPPPPVIASLSPSSAPATSAAFTLTVNGTGFAQGATVQWNGTALPTTFVSASQLTAYVSASLIASAGSASVVVTSGSTSSAATAFPINAPPAITTLSPAAAAAGGPAFTLTVNGTGFVSGAQVQWNGAPLPTTFVTATQLTASVSAGLIGSTGSVTIQVNFAGASSNGVVLPINSPPTIVSLSPVAAAAGGAAFTLTVNGTGFVSGATVGWNGTALTTKFVGVTQLTASVTAALIATAGSASVTVTSGGVASSAFTFPVNAPPAVTSLSPATVVGSGAAFTLTVNGTGFLSGTTVQFNGTTLTTTYVSATQLTAAVPANLAAGTGTASVVAVNPGGGTSVAVKLTLTTAPPAITPGGVVPIYSTASVIQPGSWISIYGTGLANGTYLWKGDFPTSLGGTSVMIDNKPAYLWSVSPTQINLQAPSDTATGTVNVTLTTASGSTTATVTLAQYAPSLSLLPASNYAAGVILTPNGSGAYGGGVYDLSGPAGFFTFSTRPVKVGETLELFGVGFGPTNPVVAPGKAFTGKAPTTNPVTITIGGINAQVLFSGITEAGLYQFNVVVPTVGSGDQPLLASVGGVQSPGNVLLTVQ